MAEQIAVPTISITPDPRERETRVVQIVKRGELTRGVARVIHLEPGLYALRVGGATGAAARAADAPGLLTQIAVVPGAHEAGARIVGGAPGDTSWIDGDGGTVVVRAPSGGSEIYVTTYCDDESSLHLPELQVRQLDRNRAAAIAGSPEIRTEIVVHVERQGDRRFPGTAWAGNIGQRLRIEGFSIRPLEEIAARDLEFRGFGPDGQETPWVTDARLCGTRGRALPLTGFAVRVAERLAGRFDVTYRGAFFDSGIVGPCRNGEACRPRASSDDPLEAIEVRLTRR